MYCVCVCQIKSYPRVIPETLRNKDSRRVKARLAVHERKRLVSDIYVIILKLFLIYYYLCAKFVLICSSLCRCSEWFIRKLMNSDTVLITVKKEMYRNSLLIGFVN